MANGRELTYLEGWYAITEANRIFGFDGWSRETIESKCILAREKGGTFLAVYVARVRLTVQANGATVIREGHGTGEGRGTSPGEVHDIALKAAETDATKRALATFGRPFGLELYRGGKATAQQKSLPSSPSIAANEANETRLVPDPPSAPDHQDRTVEASSDVASFQCPPPAAGSRAGFHAEAMAAADESFYREVARSGYRAPYLRALAGSVAGGEVDLEALTDPELPDDEVAAQLLALPGIGPYGAAHVMLTSLGRYSRLVLDSWTRPTYAKLAGRKAKDSTIERRFRRYREWAGLAFWLYLTRDWVKEET